MNSLGNGIMYILVRLTFKVDWPARSPNKIGSSTPSMDMG